MIAPVLNLVALYSAQSSDAGNALHTLSRKIETFALTPAADERGILHSFEVQCLSRWSAVVRGAVDTGCRRNNRRR